jgi:hypothetical protein
VRLDTCRVGCANLDLRAAHDVNGTAAPTALRGWSRASAAASTKRHEPIISAGEAARGATRSAIATGSSEAAAACRFGVRVRRMADTITCDGTGSSLRPWREHKIPAEIDVAARHERDRRQACDDDIARAQAAHHENANVNASRLRRQ